MNSETPSRKIATETLLVIGKDDVVTPPHIVVPAAEATFGNLQLSIVDDDHLLHHTYLTWTGKIFSEGIEMNRPPGLCRAACKEQRWDHKSIIWCTRKPHLNNRETLLHHRFYQLLLLSSHYSLAGAVPS